jgi:Neuraminidase (sialidase)
MFKLMVIEFKHIHLFEGDKKFYSVATIYDSVYLKANQQLQRRTNIDEIEGLLTIRIERKGTPFIKYDEALKQQLKKLDKEKPIVRLKKGGKRCV